MTIERAAEILDPEHREHYDSIETVNEACRMGMGALLKQWPMKPVKNKYENYTCPKCLNEHIFGSYCSDCGQALDWSEINL